MIELLVGYVLLIGIVVGVVYLMVCPFFCQEKE